MRAVTVAGNVRVVLRSGLKVEFGDDEPAQAKMLALKAVLASTTRAGTSRRPTSTCRCPTGRSRRRDCRREQGCQSDRLFDSD